jgi:hypothetical protein
LEIIALFNDFTVQHVSKDENTVANDLARQAWGFRSNRGKFGFVGKPDVPVCQIGQPAFGRCTEQQSVLLNQVQQNRMVQFLKLEGPEFLGLQMNQAKWWWPIMMIGGHPCYVI